MKLDTVSIRSCRVTYRYRDGKFVRALEVELEGNTGFYTTMCVTDLEVMRYLEQRWATFVESFPRDNDLIFPTVELWLR